MRSRLKFRIEGEEEFYPGPLWEPVVFDGAYPQMGGSIGDIYINRLPTSPLYYVFFTSGRCEMVTREEIEEWEHSGLMGSLNEKN